MSKFQFQSIQFGIIFIHHVAQCVTATYTSTLRLVIQFGSFIKCNQCMYVSSFLHSTVS